MVVYFILLIRQLQLLYSCNWTAVHLDHCFSCIVNWQHWIAVLFCLFSILLRSACWCLEVQVLMKGLLQITWPNLTLQQALFFGIKSSRIKWSICPKYGPIWFHKGSRFGSGNFSSEWYSGTFSEHSMHCNDRSFRCDSGPKLWSRVISSMSWNCTAM